MRKYTIFIAILLAGVANLGLYSSKHPVKVVVQKPAIAVKRVDEPLKIKSEKVYKLRYIADKEDVKLVATKFAEKYKINPEGLICMTMRESGLDGKRLNGQYKCGDSGASCGLTQIQCPTWISIRKHMGRDTDCALVHDDYENLETAAYGVSTYWAEHWTGYRLCRDEGYQFFYK